MNRLCHTGHGTNVARSLALERVDDRRFADVRVADNAHAD